MFILPLIWTNFLQLMHFSVLLPQRYSCSCKSDFPTFNSQYWQAIGLFKHFFLCDSWDLFSNFFPQSKQSTNEWNSSLCSSISYLFMISSHCSHWMFSSLQVIMCNENLFRGIDFLLKSKYYSFTSYHNVLNLQYSFFHSFQFWFF